MEAKINIAAILNEKPTETKLWSPMLGDCIYCYNNTHPEEIIIAFTDKNGEEKEWTFSYSGRTISAPDTAEVCLFPSKQMQDWSKFAWKKGDVLVSNDGGTEVIFDKWYDDTYTNFYSKHYLNSEDENNIKYFEGFVCTTDRYFLESKDAAQTYINTIEERFGSKLNLETLEIEKPKQEFKDGDIITIEDTEYKAIIIYKSNGGCMFRSYALIDNIYNQLGIDKIVNTLGRWIHLATDSEQQQLFSALEKEGKRWNPDTKQIEDLPKKYELKPFDKVLVKIAGRTWTADFFSHYDENDEELPYVCIGYGRVTHCIPYNEETKHLLGTTDEWKGGEQ